jgi:hypothetical protein
MSLCYEDTLLAAYLCSKGLALFKVDPISGLSRAPFSTPLYDDQMNQDKELLRTRGAESITQHILTADKRFTDLYVLEGLRRLAQNERNDCVLVFRVLKPKSAEYRWVREWVLPSILPDGTVALACCSELYENRVERMFSELLERRSGLMLASLSHKAFDCCLWTDEKARILSDTRECRKWIYGDTSRSLQKTPLESFVPLDQNKLALREYIKSRTNDCIPIRLRMNALVEVDIVVFPFTGKYIVGLKIVTESPLSIHRSLRRSRLDRRSPQDPKLVGNIVSEIYRNILRDWQESLEQSSETRTSYSWIVPVRCPSTPEAISDYILMSLPSHIQNDFVEATKRGDFHSCCQMLSFTVYGNVNILSASHWRHLTDNIDLVHCVFRFMLNLVPTLTEEPQKQLNLLKLVHNTQKNMLINRLDRESYFTTVYRFTIVLLSTACSKPEYYLREITWLRSCFVEAVRVPISSDRQLLTLFWISLLWGGAMFGLNTDRKREEAIMTLKKVVIEIETFKQRHPLSPIVNQQLFVALYNLTRSNLSDREEESVIQNKLTSDVFYTPLIQQLISQ